MNHADAYQAWVSSGKAWTVELEHCFGKLAGEKRSTPEGKGPPQSDLRLAHDAFMATQAYWYAVSGWMS